MDSNLIRQEFTATLMESRSGEMMTPRVNRARFLVRPDSKKRSRGVDAEGDVVTVGRAQGNHISLDDPQASAFHAEFRLVPGGAMFRDLGSTNGVWHGEVQVREGFLPEGAELRIGTTRVGLQEVQESNVPQSKRSSFGAFLGRGTLIGEMFAQLRRIAEFEVPLLLQGETGVGKELLASAVHEASRRSAKPYIALNCATLPESLFESELFGYEAGAFTGAAGSRKGILEQAEGGTVFLDEIGELPFLQQGKLLRVFDPGKMRRLGGSGPERDVDVRIITATHRDLREMVNAGTFREDLFYRLSLGHVLVPPLRERAKGNLELLTKSFAKKVGEDFGVELNLSREAKKALATHSWPGNARELLNVVSRTALVGRRENGVAEVSAQDVERALHGAKAGSGSVWIDTSLTYEENERRLDELRRKFVAAVIEECSGNKRAAAKRLEIARSHLYRLLECPD